MVNLLLSFLFSYLLGSISPAYLYGRAVRKIDIRNYGSGNIGATNTLRVLGKRAGILVLFLDVLKGLIAVLLFAYFFYYYQKSEIELLFFRISAGWGVVLGHIYPVFLGFRGGKGIATSAGVLLGVVPLATLSAFVIWLIFFLLFGYVSLASICASLFLPLFVALLYSRSIHLVSLVSFAIFLSLLTIIRHRKNIRRLLANQEDKLFKKSFF